MRDADLSLIVQNLRIVNENVNQLREDLNAKVDELKEQFTLHENKDAEYWKRVDARDTQLTLLQGLTFSSFGLWVLTWFGEQFGIKVGK